MDPTSFDLLNWRSIAMLMPILCTLLLLCNSLRQGAEQRSIGWLMLFAVAVGITAIPMIIGFAGAYERWPDLTFLPTDFSLFFGPLLFYHGRSLMLKEPLNKSTILWFAPGACHLLYQVITYSLIEDYQSKWAYSSAWHGPYIAPVLLIIATVLAGMALVRINALRKHYLSWLAEQRADELQFDAVWFTYLSVLAPLLFVTWIASTITTSVFDFGFGTAFWFDLLCIVGLFILVAEATSRIHRQFPKMDNETIQPHEQTTTDQSKDWHAEGNRIRQLLLKEQWYLQPDLTLSSLSSKVASNQSYVSRAFNSGLGQSFSDVINELRIEFAKSLIEAGGLSFIEIADISGFGSKSSFNRAFTAHARQTPSQYKAASKTLQNQKIDKYS